MLRRRLLIQRGGYEAVDLGLPSGLLWATCNVGATKETDYGDYYKYGFGSQKYDPSDETYHGKEDPLSSTADTATQVMGEEWRTPTKEEYSELLDGTLNEFVTDFNGSGISGCKFTSKTNPNAYIFLPSAGYYREGELFFEKIASYWTSTPYSGYNNKYSYSTNFSKSFWRFTNLNRIYGCTVRGVIEI